MTDNNIDTKSARYWCLFCKDSNNRANLLTEKTVLRQVFPDAGLKNAYDKVDRMTDA